MKLATKANDHNLLELLRNEILPQVQKPGQYLGNEFGAVKKDWDTAKCRMAIIYPDLYELGMSNSGLKILYQIVNNHPDYLCDRAYAPMQDMEQILLDKDLPLWGWESYKPLYDFDMLGFSLGYELVYTNILTMFNLCKIPFLTKDRLLEHPITFAGGPAVFNPEPMADYLDIFLIGDGEELITEIQDSLLESRKKLYEQYQDELDSLENFVIPTYLEDSEEELIRKRELSKEIRQKILFDLAQIKGVYVPSFYKPDPEDSYLPKPICDGIPERVEKRVVELGDFNQAIAGPVPNVSVVQDKQTMEIRRGCDRGCRFCQPGYVYLPVRERSPEDLVRLSNVALKNTGYEDYSLLSLSASDYTCLTEAARAMNDKHASNGISLSMPSQRADRFNVDLAAEVQQVRKSGVTLAPEAGTERMRKIVNKGLSQDEIFRAIKNVYVEGWTHVKLYFMIGLPFEEDSDLDGILDILSWSLNMANEVRKTDRQKYKKGLKVTCTISTFVPKSFTPFQWFPQCSREEFQRKEQYLKDGLRERGIARSVKLNCTSPDLALLESVLSRADRRWGQVVKEVWDSGSRLDSWEENFDVARWEAAAKKSRLSLDEESYKEREVGSDQPWDVLNIGLLKKFLVREWEQASKEAETLPCTENKCHACGVCFELGVKNIVTYDQSDKNPFVSEIDKEKRKASCASFLEDVGLEKSQIDGKDSLEEIREELKENYGNTDALALNGDGQKIVVRHYESKQKLRFVITKRDDLRFISHLDFQRLIERAIRRAGLPVVHTTGFNQRMKIVWGAALPLFLESDWEYIEVDLAERYENLENLKDLLGKELPNQVRIKNVEELNASNKTSINNVVKTTYRAKVLEQIQNIKVEEDYPTVKNRTGNFISEEELNTFLAKDSILIEKKVKGKFKTRDLRPAIVDMKLISSDELELVLNSTQRADEVLNSFKESHLWKVCKTKQEIE